MGDRQERKIMQLVQERMPDIRISLIRVEKNNLWERKDQRVYRLSGESGSGMWEFLHGRNSSGLHLPYSGKGIGRGH